MEKSFFRTKYSETIFNQKYRHNELKTWKDLSHILVEDVCRNFISKEEKDELKKIHTEMKFIAGGRYLYYAGKKNKFFNNCYLFKSEEDTREDWANLSWKAELCLMTGGGIGNDYSIYRGKGQTIKKTGGISSGPISKMIMINEIGRSVMQGGSRRSALYASLNWKHQDIKDFLEVKNWHNYLIPSTKISYAKIKEKDFNFPAPLDMTNISINYDHSFLEELHKDESKQIYSSKTKEVKINKANIPKIFLENCKYALMNGEPGFSFNFYNKENETLRNACAEVCSEDDSDVCNLGSINLGNIENINDFREIVKLATKFLLCGTLVADLPYEKIYKTREKNRRLGLGLMGVHEWLLKRGYNYEVVPELHEWLKIYKDESEKIAKDFAIFLSISTPKACRAIAPTGTIGILAGTTTGIEPLYAVSYKRRYLKNTHNWYYQYVIDGTAKILIEKYGLLADKIETSIDLAADYERRIKFQAEFQDYVDMAISSTINLPKWGSTLNNENKVIDFAKTLAKYVHRLRGFTCYPDGSRGGQPLTNVSYKEALKHEGKEFLEEFHDICDITGHGGTCGI
ncbi:MAG: hypothetical protein U0457_05870 [Candidatus Sericytochromatia bacterium]